MPPELDVDVEQGGAVVDVLLVVGEELHELLHGPAEPGVAGRFTAASSQVPRRPETLRRGPPHPGGAPG